MQNTFNSHQIATENALEITRVNMRDYGKMVAMGRSYPNIADGLKASYKRAIYGMHLSNKHLHTFYYQDKYDSTYCTNLHMKQHQLCIT